MKKRPLLLGLLLLAAASEVRSQQLGSLVSPGNLSRAHAALEGIDNCQKCHEPGKQVTAAKCLSCHKPIADRIAAGKGVHRAVRGECVSCHVEHAGVDADLRHLDRRRFDHRTQTGFPLAGKHAAVECAACHKTRSFLAAKPSCISCHNDAHRGALGPDCAKCHNPAVPFKESRRSFDHGKTAFPLTGAHATLRCDQCHKNGEYKPLKFAACADCHKDPHRKPLGLCESCHTTATFRTTKIDHAKTGFPLAGRHAGIACEKCHVQSAVKVRLAAGRCADCHKDVHRGLFQQDCASCHNETSFRSAPFDHAAKTRFPLTGKHAEIPCASCHKSAAAPARASSSRIVDFRGAGRECASCHRDVHKGELGSACQTCHSTRSFEVTAYRHPRNPEFFSGSHASVACEKCHGKPAGGSAPAKFKGVSFACADCHRDVHLGQVSKACETCHSVAAAKFAPSTFSHSAARFPLTGKHQTLECAKCHKLETGVFPAGSGTAVRLRGVPLDCQGCHRDPHLGQLGTSCATCHSTSTFAISRYVHKNASLAGFFSGSHAKADCAGCHRRVEGDFPSARGTAVRYKNTPTDCASCHKDAHRGVLGQRCESCHAVTRWNNASRAFHKVGVFPLEGKHILVPCESCHLKGVIKGTPTRCYDCHWIRRQDDLYRTRLGNQCETCHRATSWTAVIWDHASRTGFPLNAPHRSLACDSCHKAQNFTAATSECYSCHRSDYLHTTSPNHAAAGFPTVCIACHGAADATWRLARFDHASIYPLVGVHATQPCAACHKNNVFAGTPRDCYGCHKTDYDRSASPNHMAAGFATACQSCHAISDPSWSVAKFDHSFYPLIGVHAAQPCSACHKNNVYAGTTRDCYGCHQTQYQQAANPNHLSAGFSTACQGCHKISDATWQQGTFNHAQFFALVGVHATQPCAACHANNVFKGTPTDCYSCHKTLYQQTTNPNHAAAGFPTTCDTCHKATDANWNQATFNHAAIFPLVGVHATQPCAACHVNNVFPGTPTRLLLVPQDALPADDELPITRPPASPRRATRATKRRMPTGTRRRSTTLRSSPSSAFTRRSRAPPAT